MAVAVKLERTDVPVEVANETSNQYAVPAVRPVKIKYQANGVTELATADQPIDALPIVVPVKAAALAGAVPVPNLGCIVNEPVATVHAPLPFILNTTLVEYTGVSFHVLPNPIINPVVLVVPVGLVSPALNVASFIALPIALVLLVIPLVSVKAPVLPAILETTEAEANEETVALFQAPEAA